MAAKACHPESQRRRGIPHTVIGHTNVRLRNNFTLGEVPPRSLGMTAASFMRISNPSLYIVVAFGFI